MSPRVSLADIAVAAGVSLATVDRVINQRGGVRADKETRILAAARRLGWERSLDRPPTRIHRVVVLIQSHANPFHAELHEGIDLARRSYADLGLQLRIRHIDPNDPARTASVIAGLAGQCEALIISAPDTPAVAAALGRLAQQVPVVTLATDIAGSGRAAYVGPDDTRSGRVAGELMGRFLGREGGEILMVSGRPDLAGQTQRARGFSDVLARYYPRCALVEIVETGESTDAAARQVRKALLARPSITGIYHVSAGAGAIASVLDALGRRDVTFITHELTPNRRALLAARKLDAVIDQKPHEEARLAVETVARLLGLLAGTATSIATDVQIFLAETV